MPRTGSGAVSERLRRLRGVRQGGTAAGNLGREGLSRVVGHLYRCVIKPQFFVGADLCVRPLWALPNPLRALVMSLRGGRGTSTKKSPGPPLKRTFHPHPNCRQRRIKGGVALASSAAGSVAKKARAIDRPLSAWAVGPVAVGQGPHLAGRHAGRHLADPLPVRALVALQGHRQPCPGPRAPARR